MPNTTHAEEQVLIDHIHEIFRAFLARDRERIRELHTDDWIGFLGPSTGIERGLDDYMHSADLSLENFHGTDYEIHDSEVRIHGDLGLVYYVASYYYENADSTSGVIPLRSIDVFRRDGGQWNQAGSHIAVIPQGGKWGENSSGESADE